MEQLSAMRHRLLRGVPPCADFRIFERSGPRLSRRLKMLGLLIRGDGALRTVGRRTSPAGTSLVISSRLRWWALKLSLSMLLDYGSFILGVAR